MAPESAGPAFHLQSERKFNREFSARRTERALQKDTKIFLVNGRVSSVIIYFNRLLDSQKEWAEEPDGNANASCIGSGAQRSIRCLRPFYAARSWPASAEGLLNGRKHFIRKKRGKGSAGKR